MTYLQIIRALLLGLLLFPVHDAAAFAVFGCGSATFCTLQELINNTNTAFESSSNVLFVNFSASGFDTSQIMVTPTEEDNGKVMDLRFLPTANNQNPWQTQLGSKTFSISYTVANLRFGFSTDSNILFGEFFQSERGGPVSVSGSATKNIAGFGFNENLAISCSPSCFDAAELNFINTQGSDTENITDTIQLDAGTSISSVTLAEMDQTFLLSPLTVNSATDHQATLSDGTVLDFPVPEPASVALLGASVVLMALARIIHQVA